MLTHIEDDYTNPKRVIVIGSKGFVGSNIVNLLKKNKINVVGISKENVDLTDIDGYKKVLSIVEEDDIIVTVSAVAPVKNFETFRLNLKILENFKRIFDVFEPKYLLNIGSDAVFYDTMSKLSELSPKAPDNFHGLMHLTREIILKEVVPKTSFACLRPTLIYGKNDPHNGYGPNFFNRKIRNNEDIVLFGKGEEIRDHIWVEDVASLAVRMIQKRSYGSLNAVSGHGISFHEIAKLLKDHYNSKSKIIETERNAPMPHNGFRQFDNSEIYRVFPDIEIKKFEDGVKNLIH
jgi:UDP-glucose 4-epimerase